MANRQDSSLLWSGCRDVPAPAGCDNASENGNGETIDTIPILNTAIAARASGPFQPSTTTRLSPTAGSVGHRALGCAAVPAWAQDDDNHGDTTETATTIDPNSETAGELKSSDDVGYFRLDLDPFREGPFE